DLPLHLGAVYVFQRTSTGWAQTQLLVRPEFEGEQDPPPDEEFPSSFGLSVSLSGDRLGTIWYGNGHMPLGYLYERRGVWAPVAALSRDEGGGEYPRRMLLSGSIATLDNTDGHSGSGTGVYELPPLWELPPRVGP
ncbi:MAG TPA: hypothetical protein VIT67_07775, partial [Povalibacter sp.]